MGDFRISGQMATAPFTLTLHRGEGMCLLAMNWRVGPPPNDFVGFAIEFMEPNGDRYFALRNRLAFTDASKITDKTLLSSKLCPIQKFRWIHFPENASPAGSFTYRVTPVFMGDGGELSYGVAQTAAIVLSSETYPGQLDIAFTRGFISSQAFVDRYGKTEADVATLIPPNSTSGANGLDFLSTNPKAQEAYDWMGFEARKAILGLLDAAIADPAAQVLVVAYDLNEAEVVSRIEQLGSRVKVIVDNSGAHGKDGSAENEAARRLAKSAGAANVKRQKLGGLQHNKFIVVDGPTVKKAIGGSTNFSWRAFFVQSNNAITVQGTGAIAFFQNAFEAYWSSGDSVHTFEAAGYDVWQSLPLDGIDAKVTFSPHSLANSVLQPIADDIASTTSSLLYSLAFLYETPGPIKTAITSVTDSKDRFVYGISDRKVGGLDVTVPDGNTGVVYPEALSANVPPPFSEEPTAGAGARMHHKFVVVDFDKPTARVYVGSFNFSGAADRNNGENLLVIRDRLVTTAYAVEALSLFDHYHFRLKSNLAHDNDAPLVLAKPPATGEKPWFADDYEVAYKIRDRELFSG
jgi:hypothetical protein